MYVPSALEGEMEKYLEDNKRLKTQIQEIAKVQMDVSFLFSLSFVIYQLH